MSSFISFVVIFHVFLHVRCSFARLLGKPSLSAEVGFDEATQKVDFAEEELFKHKQNFTFGTVKLSAQSNPPA